MHFVKNVSISVRTLKIENVIYNIEFMKKQKKYVDQFDVHNIKYTYTIKI